MLDQYEWIDTHLVIRIGAKVGGMWNVEKDYKILIRIDDISSVASFKGKLGSWDPRTYADIHMKNGIVHSVSMPYEEVVRRLPKAIPAKDCCQRTANLVARHAVHMLFPKFGPDAEFGTEESLAFKLDLTDVNLAELELKYPETHTGEPKESHPSDCICHEPNPNRPYPATKEIHVNHGDQPDGPVLKYAKNIDLNILRDALTREQQEESNDTHRKERIAHILALIQKETESFRRNDTWADSEAASIAAGLRKD